MKPLKRILTQLATLLVIALILMSTTLTLIQTKAEEQSTQPQIKELWEKDLGSDVNSVAWSPDGTKLAAGLNGWIVAVFSSSGEKLWESKDLDGSVENIVWSPDGTKLAVIAIGVTVFSSSGKKLWGSQDLNDYVESAAWSPDGTKLAVGTGGNHKVIIFSSLGTILWESEDLGNHVYSIAWSPDGTKLAVGGSFKEIIVFSSSGKKLWESRGLDFLINAIVWSPDGTKLVVGTYNHIIVFSSSGKKLWESDIDEPVYSADAVVWSPDGTKLAVAAFYKKVIVFSSSGVKLWENRDLGSSNTIVWSPDGTKLAVGTHYDYAVKVIVFSSLGQNLWESEYLHHYIPVKSMAWSPDGTKLAVGAYEGYLYVFGIVAGSAPLVSFNIGGKLVVGAEIVFNASDSYDPDGEIVKYIWDFGDGEVVESSDPIVTHVYDKPGVYNVSLTVIDNDGLEASMSKVIKVDDITTDVVEIINDILDGLRSSVNADVRYYGEYWGAVYGTVVGDLIVNWYWDELKAHYSSGESSGELDELFKRIDSVLRDVNFVERLEKYLSEAGVDTSKLSEIMESYREALTYYKYIKDVYSAYKVLKEGNIAAWLITQLSELIEQGAKDAVFYNIVRLSQKHFGSLAANEFINQLENEGYYDVFNPLTENEVEDLRNYLVSLSDDDYYNLVALLSYLKEEVESVNGTYLSSLPLYDGVGNRWVGSIAWHVRYVNNAIDYWARGEKSKLIARFGNYISGAIGFKAFPPFLLISSGINMYVDQAFSVYDSFEFAALTNLGEVTKDFGARLGIYQQLADFVRHIDRHGDEINKMWDIIDESYGFPSLVTIPIGSIRYECISGASQIFGVIHSTKNHLFPYAQAILDSVGIYITEPTKGALQHQFYGSPVTCLTLKDASNKVVCSLLAQKMMLINATKPNIEIKYTSGASLGTVNVNLVNHEKSKMFVCASIYTPLISLKPDDFKCTTLSPNSEAQIFTNVNVGKALVVTAGSGYIVHFIPSITLDIIGNWIGSIVTLTENQHKLFAKVTDDEGRIVGIENGDLKIEIPGAYYVDFMNGTIKIFLPPSLTEYNVIVDASNATDKLETYTLHITKVDNGELISAITINATITQKEKQIGTVRIHENQLELTNINMNITESSTKGQASIISATTTPTTITTTNTTIQTTTTSPSNTITQTTTTTASSSTKTTVTTTATTTVTSTRTTPTKTNTTQTATQAASRTTVTSKTTTPASTTTPTSGQQTSILGDSTLYIAVAIGIIISIGVILAFIKKK